VPDITLLLESVARGDARAAEELLPIVYDELRKVAAHKMAGESAGHTLQATALVHEAWLRLAGPGQQQWENRGHFFAAAAEAMRRILVDHARRKQSLKGEDLTRFQGIASMEPKELAMRPAAMSATPPAPMRRTSTSAATDDDSGTLATSSGVSTKK